MARTIDRPMTRINNKLATARKAVREIDLISEQIKALNKKKGELTKSVKEYVESTGDSVTTHTTINGSRIDLKAGLFAGNKSWVDMELAQTNLTSKQLWQVASISQKAVKDELGQSTLDKILVTQEVENFAIKRIKI